MNVNVSRLTTERVEPGAHGLVAVANIEGTGLEPRAISVAVRFGEVFAEGVAPLPNAAGVRAVFRQMPRAGDRLLIGYANRPLQETDIQWVDPPPEPIALA